MLLQLFAANELREEYKKLIVFHRLTISRLMASSSSKVNCFCAHRYQGLTLKDREWQCEVCGQEHDRDECAARTLAK